MKYFVVMVIALAVFITADEEWKPVTEKEILRKIYDDCIKESGVTSEQIQKINDMEHPDDKKGHEYVRCFGTKLGVFTDDKGYIVDRLISQFSLMFSDMEQLRDIVTNCVESNNQRSTPAESAFRGHKCIMDSKVGEAFKRSKDDA